MMFWCSVFLEIHKENLDMYKGDEADILEDLGPADVRVLLQAEEELGQVPMMSQCFTPERDIIANKADLTMFYTRLKVNLPNIIAISLFSASNGRECFPNQTPHLTIFSCQRLGE